MTTAQKQAFDVAKRYIQGTEKEREIILSFFQGEERMIFLRAVGFIHLFTDQQYYDSVRNAMRDRISKEMYEEINT